MTKDKNLQLSPKVQKRLILIAFIAGIGTVLGTITAVIVFWETYGWITRSAYAADQKSHTVLIKAMPSQQTMNDILNKLKTINDSIKLNRDEWVCDKLGKETPELKKELAIAQTISDEIDLQTEIDRNDEVWIKLKCSNFRMS